uniref:Uncharacterized protein n=1 Tax=Chloropicon laureae TaxID=464258 RepID=A0A7S2Z5D8_9CHLO
MGMASSLILLAVAVAAAPLLLLPEAVLGALLSKLADASEVTTEVRDSISMFVIGLMGCDSSERVLRRGRSALPIQPPDLRLLAAVDLPGQQQQHRWRRSAGGTPQPRQQQKSRRKSPRKKSTKAWPSVFTSTKSVPSRRLFPRTTKMMEHARNRIKQRV